MTADDLFAIVEHQRLRGPYEGNVSFRDCLKDAVELADELTAASSTTPRPSRFVVYRMEEVEESEFFDWAYRSPDGFVAIGPFEQQVRANCPAGHTVVCRRLGTTEWTTAPEEER